MNNKIIINNKLDKCKNCNHVKWKHEQGRCNFYIGTPLDGKLCDCKEFKGEQE